MAVLDDIAAERQRLTERLARVEAERQKLADQIAELDAAERVLSRLGSATAGRRGRRARSAAATDKPSAPAARRGRARSAGAADTATAPAGRRRRAGRKARAKPQVPLGDAILRAVETLGNEVSAEQIREYLGREFGMQVRPNHLGMTLQRHRRAGRLRADDG